jgi:uncharacterized Zn finger protein (UPF0148 family)
MYYLLSNDFKYNFEGELKMETLRIKKLGKVTCPVCGNRFQQRRRDHIYDSASCNQKAYHYRLRRKLERLAELEKKGAA